MNIDDEIKSLKDLQNLTGGYTTIALENIKLAPFLFIDHLESVDLFVSEFEINVHLHGKKTLAGWFYRTFQKKYIKKNLTLLGKYIYYWCPQFKVMPKINFYWGNSKNEQT